MWNKDVSRLREFTFDVAKLFFTMHGAIARQESRGYKFFIEGFIHDVWMHEKELTVKGKCYHSQKRNEKPHTLYMLFQQQDVLTVQKCHCSCEVGLSQSCHHVVGLAYYLQDVILRGQDEIPSDQASTSKPMQWNKPRGTKVLAENILSVTFYKPTKLMRAKKPIAPRCVTPYDTTIKGQANVNVGGTRSKISSLKQTLCQINNQIPFSYLLGNTEDDTDETMTTLVIQKPKNMDMTEEFAVSLPVLDTACTNILISLPLPQEKHWPEFTFDDAQQTEKRTRHQNNCPEWFKHRQQRFTASQFGILCKRRKAVDRDFFQKLWTQTDLSHIKSVEHGIKQEKTARDMYMQSTKNKVSTCGLIIHPYAPYLGASPDGLVWDVTNNTYGLLEIKCPYSKKSATLKTAMTNPPFILQSDENMEPTVNVTHNYYYQIQGQMLLVGLHWCDLCIYFKRSNELIIHRVHLDEGFCKTMYRKLTTLYSVYLSLN